MSEHLSSAADHVARLIRQGTFPPDAIRVAAQQGGVKVSEVQAELARRSGARRSKLRRIRRRVV